jgi:hypothetical protein
MTGPVAAYQQGANYSAAADREILGAGMWSKLAAGHPVPYEGVIFAGAGCNLAVLADTGWHTKVEPGSAIVAGYRVTIPAAVTLAHDAATTTARRDLVIVRVKDQESGDASDVTTVEIVKGTSTADPAIPSRSMIIGQVNIRASATSIVSTDVVERRKFTAGAGGIVAAAGIANVQSDLPDGSLIYDWKTGFHHKKTPGGVAPLSPIGSALFQGFGYRVENATEMTCGPLTPHPHTLGDVSFCSVEGDAIRLHPYEALYTVTFNLGANQMLGSGVNYIGISWDGNPTRFAVGLPSFPYGQVSAVCVIGPPAETVLRFQICQNSGTFIIANSFISVTRWS